MMIDGKEIKAVVFDMDGVLYDTERISMQSWHQIGKLMDIADIEQTTLDCVGRNRTGIITYFEQKYGADFPTTDFLNQTREHSLEIIKQGGLPVMKGAREILSYLAGKDCAVALASSTREATVLAHLEETGMRACFQAVICGDMVKRGKPAPDIYELACRKLDVSPETAVAIEDSPNGIRSAHAAGLLPLMVPDMVQPTPEIEALLWRKESSLLAVMELFKTDSPEGV